ncbi:MAG: triple tyrosine motif-containing protein [Rheinheimera sp.]|nr:triple tyrosine motif-containing protein [Rheinheimera sp.]
MLISTARHFVFDHQAQGLKIEFSSLNFRDQSKIRYKFWLEGKQELHYPLQMTPSVIFPELAAGEYQFKVQAISQTTDLASPVATIIIRIQPAPWLSEPFRLHLWRHSLSFSISFGIIIGAPTNDC